jgi:hypothetical protein
MTMNDAVQLVATVNPVLPEVLPALEAAPERELVRARIDARRHETHPGQSRRRAPRKVAVAAVLLIVLSVPSLALSGTLGSLFGFSNHGTPVTQGDLSSVSALLNLTGAKPGSLVQLAARGGWAVYAARTASGGVCYYDGPAGKSNLNAIGGGCMNPAASANFPSSSRPVWDMSLYETGPQSPGANLSGPSIARLEGVAANGVISVQLLALSDCRVVATAPVIHNVYIATDLPLIPEAVIVARDGSGNAVWHEAVTPDPSATSCGLG